MRSCYVTWKGGLSLGITLTKLTELEGHMPKDIHKIQNLGQKHLNKEICENPGSVNHFKVALVHFRRTMRAMVSGKGTFVPLVWKEGRF